MSPRYFQGQSLTGPVRASVARTFREVVDAFRLPPNLGLTREAFFALDEESRNERKRVPFFVPAVFKSSPSKRQIAEATHCNLIFLDIDPEKENKNGKWVETGRYPAAPFLSDPSLLNQRLTRFNFAAHTTASSTPNAPRMRVVVDAEKIPLSMYPRAVMAIAALLGLPSITRESKVAVQPMFLPVMFADSTDDDHPLISYGLNGRSFTIHDIGEDLFPEFEANSKAGANGTAPHGLDSLDFLRAPVPEISLPAVKEALFHLDADCSRAEWLETAAALKHQFAPGKEEEAFDLFDEWSAEGSKYKGEEDTRAMWKSLRQTPVGRVPVTIRSLLKHAVAAGWDDGKVKENCFQKLIRWMEEAESVTELIDKGVSKIMGTPLLSNIQEDVLANQLCAFARKRFSYTVSVKAIRADMARLKKAMRDAERQPDTEKQREPQWTKSVCYIANAQHFYRHRTGEKYRPDSFNAIYARHLLPTEDSLREAGLPVTPATLSKPIVAPVEFALNHIKISTVYDYAYDPSQPTEMYFVNRGRRYVNTYNPTYPESDSKNLERARRLFETHLSNLIGEREYRDTLTDFLAFLVQSPGRKIRWAVLLQSVDGAGKTFLAEMLKAVLGSEHVQMINGQAIKSGYNEWAFGHQVIVLEEVRVAGTNRHEIMNALKPLITNDAISINEKFRNQREVANISNYILFSNHHDALALTPGDRRYFVIKSPLQAKDQVLKLGENYFPPLFDALRDIPGAFRAYLQDWEISPTFNPNGHAPRTKYVQDLINDSAPDITAAVRRLMLEGDHSLIQFDIVSAKTLMDALHIEEGFFKVSAQQVGAVLREEGLHQIGRHLIGEERHYLWSRPGIDENEAVQTANDRLKTGAKNLCMELIYG